MAQTQKERLATLEAQQESHNREHAFLRELWTAQLEAIGSRLSSIEASLNGLKTGFNGNGANGGNGRRRISRRDMEVFGTSVALATALWWLVDLLRGTLEG